jgi:hypothetical protein
MKINQKLGVATPIWAKNMHAYALNLHKQRLPGVLTGRKTGQKLRINMHADAYSQYACVLIPNGTRKSFRNAYSMHSMHILLKFRITRGTSFLGVLGLKAASVPGVKS